MNFSFPEIGEDALRNIASLFVYDAEAPLLFSSGVFWILFLIFLPIYSLLKKRKLQMSLFVVAFSLYFYYKSSGLFFLMLMGTSMVDWLVSRWIAATRGRGARLAMMWFSIALSLSILGYFKYSRSEEQKYELQSQRDI